MSGAAARSSRERSRSSATSSTPTGIRDTIIKARHLVDNLNEVHCVTGDAIQGNIERVVKARKELGIT